MEEELEKISKLIKENPVAELFLPRKPHKK